MNPDNPQREKEEPFMIKMPDNFEVHYGFDESIDKASLAKAYQEIFSAEPWNEEWDEDKVTEKLKKEIDCPGSVLTLMKGKDNLTQGFSWGKTLDVADIEKEASSALGLVPDGLFRELSKKISGRLFYFYEVAILPQARAGFNPIRFLVRPGLELADNEGINQSIFWTTPESKILRTSMKFGYEPVFECEDSHHHKIVFLLNRNPDFLNALRQADHRGLAKFEAKPH